MFKSYILISKSDEVKNEAAAALNAGGIESIAAVTAVAPTGFQSGKQGRKESHV